MAPCCLREHRVLETCYFWHGYVPALLIFNRFRSRLFTTSLGSLNSNTHPALTVPELSAADPVG